MKNLSIVLLFVVLAAGLAIVPARAGDAGQDLPPGQDRVTIPVSGMTCGGCAAAIDRSVKKLGGVVAVDVDHLEGTVTVVRVTDQVTVERIVEAINKTGFKASNPEKG